MGAGLIFTAEERKLSPRGHRYLPSPEGARNYPLSGIGALCATREVERKDKWFGESNLDEGRSGKHWPSPKETLIAEERERVRTLFNGAGID